MTHPPGSLDNILAAMEAARAKGVPSVVIQHTATQEEGSPVFVKGNTGWGGACIWKSSPAHAPSIWYMEKHLPGSFTDTNLEAWLRSQEVETMAICGYMTQMRCDTTARQAHAPGFQRGIPGRRHRHSGHRQCRRQGKATARYCTGPPW